MEPIDVGRRAVLAGVAVVLGLGAGVASVAAQQRAVQQLRLKVGGRRALREFFAGNRPLRVLVGGARIRASDYAVATFTATGDAGTRTHTYQDGDDLILRARQGRAGHEVVLRPGFFRPEIGDEVVLVVSFFDEADALFGKGVLTVSGFDGKGNETVTEERQAGERTDPSG